MSGRASGSVFLTIVCNLRWVIFGICALENAKIPTFVSSEYCFSCVVRTLNVIVCCLQLYVISAVAGIMYCLMKRNVCENNFQHF